jgi:hypothetical protein
MRWLRYQSYILRNDEFFGCVPAGLVDQDNDEEVFEVLRDFLEEEIHHFRVCVGKDERGDLPQSHAYCGVYVYERSDNLSRCFWPHPPGSPAGSMLVYTPKSAFVLSHDRNRPFVLRVSLGHDFGYLLGEFFLKSSWACASAWT